MKAKCIDDNGYMLTTGNIYDVSTDNTFVKEDEILVKNNEGRYSTYPKAIFEIIEESKIPENVQKFVEKCKIMADIYEQKNKKYGNSFSKTYQEYGKPVLCIRLEDKLSRIKQLLLNGQEGTADESVTDTLIDMANYAIMAVMELEK